MLNKTIVCFHNPEEENGYLSNWYLSGFRIGDVLFSSMEQYMMYRKARLFGDMHIAQEILATDDMRKIKELGRRVSGYHDTVWNGMRQVIVYQGLVEKFQQNATLRKLLLETGDSVLAECAVKDRIWGIGLSMVDANRLDMSKWKGQNLLGFALVEVRRMLREQSE